jgi:hypothetical protein
MIYCKSFGKCQNVPLVQQRKEGRRAGGREGGANEGRKEGWIFFTLSFTIHWPHANVYMS